MICLFDRIKTIIALAALQGPFILFMYDEPFIVEFFNNGILRKLVYDRDYIIVSNNPQHMNRMFIMQGMVDGEICKIEGKIYDASHMQDQKFKNILVLDPWGWKYDRTQWSNIIINIAPRVDINNIYVIEPRSYIEHYASVAAEGRELSGRDALMAKQISDDIVKNFSFRPDDHVVDIGCGDGALLKAVTTAGVDAQKGRLIGVLPSDNEIRSLKALLNNHYSESCYNIDLIKGDFHSTNVPSCFSDVTISNSVFQYLISVENIREALSEISRITKPQGRVFIGEIPSIDESSDYRSVVRQGKLFFMNPENFSKEMKDKGLEVERIYEFDIKSYIPHSNAKRFNYIAVRK